MAKKLGINNPLFETTTPAEVAPAEKKPTRQQAKKPAAEKKKMGRPRSKDIVRNNTVQAGLTEEYTRATFIMKVETLDALKDYAFTKRISIKDAITDIIDGFIADYKENPDNEELLNHKK